MRVFIKTPLLVDVNGRTESLGQGHTLDLPDVTAKSLVAAGHATEVRAVEEAVSPAGRRR